MSDQEKKEKKTKKSQQAEGASPKTSNEEKSKGKEEKKAASAPKENEKEQPTKQQKENEQQPATPTKEEKPKKKKEPKQPPQTEEKKEEVKPSEEVVITTTPPPQAVANDVGSPETPVISEEKHTEKKVKERKTRVAEEGVGIVKAVLSGDNLVILFTPKHGPPMEKQITLSNVSAPKIGRNKQGTITKDEVTNIFFLFYPFRSNSSSNRIYSSLLLSTVANSYERE